MSKPSVAGIFGGDPLVPDQVNGGFLKDIPRYTDVTHDQVFGVGGHWTKMPFYVKMNSSVGAKDGLFSQYVNGQRTLHYSTVPWISANIENKMAGWNYFALGGNDYFQAHANELQKEEWYAIDDVVVRDSLPTELL
jgi:hypothetical protein